MRREGRKKTAWLVGRSNFIISPVPVPVHGGAEDDKKENIRREGDILSNAATSMAYNKPRPMMRKRKWGQVVWRQEMKQSGNDKVDRGRSLGESATTTMIGLVDSAAPLAVTDNDAAQCPGGALALP